MAGSSSESAAGRGLACGAWLELAACARASSTSADLSLRDILDAMANAIPAIDGKQWGANKYFQTGTSFTVCRVWLLQPGQPDAGRRHLLGTIQEFARERMVEAGYDYVMEDAALQALHHNLVHSTNYEIACLLYDTWPHPHVRDILSRLQRQARFRPQVFLDEMD